MSCCVSWQTCLLAGQGLQQPQGKRREGRTLEIVRPETKLLNIRKLNCIQENCWAEASIKVDFQDLWAGDLDIRLGRPSWFQRVCWYESWRLLRKKEVQAAGITIPGAYKESFQVAIQQRITEIVYELLRIYAYLVFTFELLHLVDSAGLLGLAAALTWSLKDVKKKCF